METALLLIDIQNDYFPGGKMEVPGSPQASLMAKKALDHFRNRGLPVIHVQHIAARVGATFLVPNSEGVEIHEHVKPLPGELVVQKHYPNSFRDTPLLDHLKDNGLRKLVVCGMMTHMCVDASVRAAFDHGCACVVLSDGCAARGLSHQGVDVSAEFVHAAFMSALGAVYARVLNTDDFLAGAAGLK
ncbi:MAG: cysteine hydrolase [Desulfomonile tiedjei]|nr:cysteine hydrolase [Desulfomonile tiedjei]